MFTRTVVILSTLFLAFFILSVSVLKAASISYSFYPEQGSLSLGKRELAKIDYQLPYPGSILPGDALWNFKAIRDRLWLATTSNSSKKAELMLLFADKRLAGSKVLFEEGKSDLAFSSLTKAEKYLNSATDLTNENTKKGVDTKKFYSRLASASLKHKEVMEYLVSVAPEDAKPKILNTLVYPQNVYEKTRNALLSKGVNPPQSPFNGE